MASSLWDRYPIDDLRYYSREQLYLYIFLSLAIALVSSSLLRKNPRVPGAKVHGRRFLLEPSILLQWRFVTSAYDIIDSGYKNFKDIPFVVRRYDTDITVLPMKYLDEMRLIPRHLLNGKKAQVSNLVPRWTWTNVMMESDLHVKVLNEKLNPDLQVFLEAARTELEYAWRSEMPELQDWTEIDIQQHMRNLVARMSARVFMGKPVCRDPEWLRLSIEFTYNMFQAAFTLRMFPPATHWIVAHFIPARWRIRRDIRVARRIVGSLLSEHQEKLRDKTSDQDTLLNWMYDNGTAKERDISEMAARQCIMTLASIHTTALGVANFLFDLCTYPEWYSVLVDEINSIEREHGMLGEQSRIPSRVWLQKLEKMDSFIVESQRFNPPILLNPQRMAMTNITLRDGTKIPRGTRIAWAGHHHANDPSRVKDSNSFDPLRNYRKRHDGNQENVNKFSAGRIDKNSLSFGYGNQACPGRHFAVNEIKLLLTKLLLEYEFRLPEGKTRPKIMYADENVFMDPHAKVLARSNRCAL